MFAHLHVVPFSHARNALVQGQCSLGAGGDVLRAFIAEQILALSDACRAGRLSHRPSSERIADESRHLQSSRLVLATSWGERGCQADFGPEATCIACRAVNGDVPHRHNYRSESRVADRTSDPNGVGTCTRTGATTLPPTDAIQISMPSLDCRNFTLLRSGRCPAIGR